MLIKKIFFKSNHQPRSWVKYIIFDEDLQVKSWCRFFVFNSTGDVRKHFSRWYLSVSRYPSPKIDPQWIEKRNDILNSKKLSKTKNIAIISPLSTIYVARMIRSNIARWGIEPIMLDVMPEEFPCDLYIVICPQMFPALPSREKLIIYQMEQSVSERWFTTEYFNILYNSLAVFDYSRRNIKYIEINRPNCINLKYVPIELIPLHILKSEENNYFEQDRYVYDVVFYGDSKSPRRKKFLKRIQKHFRLKILNGVYGVDLWNELAKAKLIVNIHYYENALLETTRISECLSLGLTVISEVASDQVEHQNLIDKLIFTPINDIDAMIQAIEKELSAPSSVNNKTFNDAQEIGSRLKMALESVGVMK